MSTPHRSLLFSLSLSLFACEPRAGHAPSLAPASSAAPSASAASAVAKLEGSAPTRGAWLEDSADRAFQAAREQQRLLLADLWAPWCHTCLSMQALVLTEARVPELSSFVKLSIDTERSDNERFLQSYPAVVWPTFYLIDPVSGRVRGRWLGGATPEQLGEWLREAAGSAEGTEALLRQADGLAAERRLAEAEATYRAALPSANPAERSRALVALISTLLKQKKLSDCLALADGEGAQLPPSVSAVDFAATALACADASPDVEHARTTRVALMAVLARDCATRAPA